MNGWRENANRYRQLLGGAVSQKARHMLEELASEADAIAADDERKTDSESLRQTGERHNTI
jgi:hypothetical protein